MGDIKERGYIYENNILYSIEGNISEWEKNFIKNNYNIDVNKQAKLKELDFNLKATYFDKLENKAIKINWNIENNILIINDKKFKVENDYNYTYKILKTKIKANGGIKGLIKFIIQSSDFESVFNNNCYLMLLKIYNTVKTI